MNEDQDNWKRVAIMLLINGAAIIRIEANAWRAKGEIGKAQADERMAEAMERHAKS